jgi:molybdopterin-guanine dinucleotide biosynthesis protein A
MFASKLKIGGAVLCGGHSRRMGASKPWLEFNGEPLLQRMVRIVSDVASPVVVAARAGQSLPLLPGEVGVVYDELENAGPLAGLAMGMRELSETCDAVFVTSCDHPLLRPGFVARLVDLLGDHPAIVPSQGGFVHALTAVYRVETLSILTELLESGERRVGGFVEHCGAHVIDAALMCDVDPQLYSLRNANDTDTFEALGREDCDRR